MATAKVNVSTIENPAEASFFESFEAAHSMHDLSVSIAKKLGVTAPPVRMDSQAKYGAVARGVGARYLCFPHQGVRKIWDHAAGYIVVAGVSTATLAPEVETVEEAPSGLAEWTSYDVMWTIAWARVTSH